MDIIVDVPLDPKTLQTGSRVVAVEAIDGEHYCHVFRRHGGDALSPEHSFTAQTGVALAGRVLAGDTRVTTDSSTLRILAAGYLALACTEAPEPDAITMELEP